MSYDIINKALIAHSRYAGAQFPFLPSGFYRKCIFCHIHHQSGSLYRSQVSVCLRWLPSSKRVGGANYIITNTRVTLFQHISPLSQGFVKSRNPEYDDPFVREPDLIYMLEHIVMSKAPKCCMILSNQVVLENKLLDFIWPFVINRNQLINLLNTNSLYYYINFFFVCFYISIQYYTSKYNIKLVILFKSGYITSE